MKSYLVGGAVRDNLLGLPVTDKDYVVVGATPDQLHQLGYKPVGKDFPVFLHPETKFEYALARTERKTGHGYSGFTFYADPSVSLEEDLLRRDLTINAIAMADNGELIDPYHGQHDLSQKILRHVSPAFCEDPVRVLRIARFMARFAPLGFTIAEETKILLRRMVRQGEIHHLVPERVWQEWQKALTEPAPQAFIQTLRECGALKLLFPEIDALFGVPSRPDYHPEIDTGTHVLMVTTVAARLSENPLVRFAALLHDLGKGVTPPREWPSHPGHEAAGIPLIKQVCERYKVPRDYQDLALMVAEYHLHVHRTFELKPATLLKLFENLDVFRRPARFELFLLACEADFYGRSGWEDKPFPQKAYLIDACERVRACTVKELGDISEFSGEEIKKKLHQKRLSVLAHL